jgi:hypothetical protein
MGTRQGAQVAGGNDAFSSLSGTLPGGPVNGHILAHEGPAEQFSCTGAVLDEEFSLVSPWQSSDNNKQTKNHTTTRQTVGTDGRVRRTQGYFTHAIPELLIPHWSDSFAGRQRIPGHLMEVLT